MATTRIEVRALHVRRLRTSDTETNHLPVAGFSREATADDPNPPKCDLYDVLCGLLDSRVGKVEIMEPSENAAADEDPGIVEARRKRNRKAVQIRKVVPDVSARRIRADLEWSSSPPPSIMNLETREIPYENISDDDASFLPTTIIIEVPKSPLGFTAFMGVEHRSGVVTSFEPQLIEWFRDDPAMQDFRLSASGYVPEAFWERFLSEGIVLQLTLEKDEIPKDVSDLHKQNVAGVISDKTTMVVGTGSRLLRGGREFIDRSRQAIQNKNQATPGVFVVEDIQFDTLKARIELDGIQRTIEIGTELGGRIAPAFPVEILSLPNGFAAADDLAEAIEEILGSAMPDAN